MKLHKNPDTEPATEVFAALGDPTRQRIVELLAEGGELRLSDLAREFDSTRQTVTRHLDVLCAAGITETTWQGRERRTSLSPDAFDPVRDWLSRYDRFWDERLERLKTLIEGGHDR
jgi:DNA-binding transcriptional ArsR family regulator